MKEEILYAKQITQVLSEIEKEHQQKFEKERTKQAHNAALAEANKILKRFEELQKREEILLQREHDFYLATQGHIYSNSKKQIEIEENNKNSLNSQFDMLRNSFQNGEISFEEYQKEREKLW